MGKLGDLWDKFVDFIDGDDDKKKSTTNTAKKNDKLLSQGQGPITGNTKPIVKSVSGNMVPNTNTKKGQKVTAAPTNKQSDADAANHASARKNYAEKNGVYNPATGTHQVKVDTGKKVNANTDILSHGRGPVVANNSPFRVVKGTIGYKIEPTGGKKEESRFSASPEFLKREETKRQTQGNVEHYQKIFDETAKKLGEMRHLNSIGRGYKIYSDDEIAKCTSELETIGNVLSGLYEERGETEKMFDVRSRVSNAVLKKVDEETSRSIHGVTIPRSIRQSSSPELDDAVYRQKANELAKKYVGKEYTDSGNDVSDFFNYFGANRSVGKLGEASADSGYAYADSPTDAREYYKATVEDVMNIFMGRNENTVGKGGLISKNLATYLPQLEGQIKEGLPLALIGAAIGATVGAPVIGFELGFSAGSGRYSYEQMYGASFNELSEVTDFETAKRLARDEGLISGGVETLDTLWDIASLGGGAVLKALGKETVKKIGKESLFKLLGGYALNVLGEGTQEGVQELISIANERRAINGDTDSGLIGLVKETVSLVNEIARGENDGAWLRAKEAGVEGMKTAAVVGGASLGINTATAKLLDGNTENVRKRDAFDEIVDMGRTEDEVYYLIDENFEQNYDKWVSKGKSDGVVLTVGRTSEALKSIGVKEQSVTWDTSNINRSLKEHPYLNDTIMKQIPHLVENPIIVMQSKKSDSRITMFGEVYDVDGVPIMAVLELAPTNRKGTATLDVIKIASTHSRKSSNPNKAADMTQTQSMINTSDILYVEPNKERTDNWLVANRLQLPLHITNYGSIKSVTYPDGNVNTYDMRDAQNNNKNFDIKGAPPKVADIPVGRTTGLTAADIESGNISDELKARLEKYKNVLSRLGFSVTYVPNREIADNVIGYADITNREVYLSPEHIDDALMMHELTHVIDRGFNSGYIKSLVSFFKREFSEDWNKAIKKAEENYKNIPGANLEAEALADMCMRFTEKKYINMAESMDVKNLKQICLMFQYMMEKVKSVFSDDVTAHKLKMASLKWQLALRKAISRGEASNRRGLLYVLTNQGVNVKAQDEYVEAVQMYEREFSGYKSGELPERGYYIIGKPSPVMEKYTNGTDEIIMDVDVVVKATGGKHSISMDEMSMLAEKMLDPLMIFKSDTVNNAYVVFVEMKNKNNVPVVVALHMDKKRGRLSVSNIASVHSRVDTDSGKDKTQNFINEQVRKGNFVYANEKSQSWFSTFGLQLPSVVQTFIDSNRIVSQDGENSNKNLSTNDDVSFAVATDENSVDDESVVADEGAAGDKSKKSNTGINALKYYQQNADELLEELDTLECLLDSGELDADERLAALTKKHLIEKALSGKSKYVEDRIKDVPERELTGKAKKVADAVKAYRETGDVREADKLPTKRSLKTSEKYRQGKISSINRELNQLIRERNAEGVTDSQREELDMRINELFAQLREIAQRHKVYEEAYKILEEIDTAARPNHSWLNEVVDEVKDSKGKVVDDIHLSEKLQDKDGIIKDGKYMFNDVERNFRHFFGKYYKKAYDAIIQPLFDSKKRYSKGVKGYRKKMHEEIVKGLGIRTGSKESAAVMWLGEGMRPLTKAELIDKFGKEKAKEILESSDYESLSEAFTPYTYKDCVKEFGEDAAQNIEKATEIFRSYYDELIDEVNKTRAMLYPNNPDKLVAKRTDYFHHFQEMGQGFAGLRNIFSVNNDIDPLLVGTSEFTQPKSKWQGFMQRRLGYKTEYDAVEGFLRYLPAAMHSIHIDPNIVNIRSLAYDLASAKAEENGGVGNTNANRFIEYLQAYANDLAGKTTSYVDRELIRHFGRMPIAVLSWLNNRTKASAVLGNLYSVLSQFTNVKNMVGKIEHQSDAVRGAVQAVAGLNPNGEIAKRYEESGFLAERYLDKSERLFESNWQKMNPVKWAADILGFADEVGTRITWNAAYNEAVRKNIKDAVQYADNFTRACVAGRGIGEEALVFKSQVAKMFLPFRTEVLNDIRVQQDILFGEEYDIWDKNVDGNNEENYVDLSFDNELVFRVKNMRGAEKYKVIRDFILELLGDKDIVFSDGLVVKVDKSDALHIANKSANNKTTYISKLEELIQKSKLYATANEVKHNKFDEFKYYRVDVKLEGETYPVYLNVGRAKNGDGYHLYDITKKIGEPQSIALERVNKDLRSEIDSPIDFSISQNEGKSNKNVSTKTDAFDEIVNMGKADGSKIKQGAGKRIKNIMQLYVASMIANAVIAAIKSDEFEPAEEAKEGYEENGVLGALISVMEDYADGIGDPVAFDPIYDIVTGIYQGIEEGESAGEKAGFSALRSFQNFAGDAVSNNPFSTIVLAALGVGEDETSWAFNDSMYNPGGMGMPLASNMASVLHELYQKDWGAAGAAVVKPFLPLGTQADRTFKGMYDWAKGYSTTESAYDRMFGTDGDLKYLIDKNPETFMKSLLFGPGAFSDESDAFFEGRKFSEEEQAEILAHDDYKGRKTEFDKILEWHDYKKFAKGELARIGEEYYAGKENTPLYELYNSTEDKVSAAVPFKQFYETIKYKWDDVNYETAVDVEISTAMSYAYGERIKPWLDELNEDETFGAMSIDERKSYLNSVTTLESNYVKTDWLHRLGRMPQKEYDEYVAWYNEKIVEKVEELKNYEFEKLEEQAKTELAYADAYSLDGAEAYVKYNATATAGQYVEYYDGKMSNGTYNEVMRFAHDVAEREPDEVDRELARLSGATGSKINVSGNAYGVVSYSKKKVEYKIDIPDSEVYNLCSTVDREVRSGLKSLFASSSYKSASAEAQKDMVANVKQKIRGKIKARYKAKYPSIRVDSILNVEEKVSGKVSDLFDEIINMK